MTITVRVARFALLLMAAVALFGARAMRGSGRTLARATPARTPPADTFDATITGSAPRAGDHGSAMVLLMRGAASPGGAVQVTITFLGNACHCPQSCVLVRGRLTGQMTAQRSLADVGRSYRIIAAGTLTPLGHVTATGTATGTGFIRSGHTRLSLTLAVSGGTVTVQGVSPTVPGFTQP